MNKPKPYLKYCKITTNKPPLQLIAKQFVELYNKVEEDQFKGELIKQRDIQRKNIDSEIK